MPPLEPGVIARDDGVLVYFAGAVGEHFGYQLWWREVWAEQLQLGKRDFAVHVVQWHYTGLTQLYWAGAQAYCGAGSDGMYVARRKAYCGKTPSPSSQKLLG